MGTHVRYLSHLIGCQMLHFLRDHDLRSEGKKCYTTQRRKDKQLTSEWKWVKCSYKHLPGILLRCNKKILNVSNFKSLKTAKSSTTKKHHMKVP